MLPWRSDTITVQPESLASDASRIFRPMHARPRLAQERADTVERSLLARRERRSASVLRRHELDEAFDRLEINFPPGRGVSSRTYVNRRGSDTRRTGRDENQQPQ